LLIPGNFLYTPVAHLRPFCRIRMPLRIILILKGGVCDGWA
jgi:hypothetical protein